MSRVHSLECPLYRILTKRDAILEIRNLFVHTERENGAGLDTKSQPIRAVFICPRKLAAAA